MRRDRLNLNGHGDFALANRHALEPAAWTGKILVPFPVESALPGAMKTISDPHRLRSHRAVSVPATW